jgi:hypothetical protein
MKGAVHRFGIRWDDGQRPKRFLLPLAAALAALAITPAAGSAPAGDVPAPEAPRAAAFSA